MYWLSAVLGKRAPQMIATPPCIARIGGEQRAQLILSDSLDHVHCALQFLQAGARAAGRRRPPEDSVSFDDLGSATRPLSAPRREEVLLVLLHAAALPDVDAIQGGYPELKIAALHCPRSRFPNLPLIDFVHLAHGIVEWQRAQPSGVVVYASQNAASKQLLLYAAVKMWLSPEMSLEAIGVELETVSRERSVACARGYSFVNRPAHPSPTLVLKEALFPSQKRLLQHWAVWLRRRASGCLPLMPDATIIRLSHVSVSVTAGLGDLLETFGDEHPTLELWLSPSSVLSSRPALTLKALDRSADAELASVSVQTLELINSVVRRNERTSYHWECDLDTVSTQNDLLVRLSNARRLFRLQLHAQFLQPHQADRAPFELHFENDQIDGYDLCGGTDALKIRLLFDAARASGETPELQYLFKHP